MAVIDFVSELSNLMLIAATLKALYKAQYINNINITHIIRDDIAFRDFHYDNVSFISVVEIIHQFVFSLMEWFLVSRFDEFSSI